MEKKLRKVIQSIKKASVSYQDKKAEQILSEALLTVRDALKKNTSMLLLETMPLFSKQKASFEENGELASQVASTTLGSPKLQKEQRETLENALKKIKPKVRSRIKTLLRDDRRIIKKVKIGGSEFLVSFAHLGSDEKESFTEGGIIFINRDHELFKKVEGKSELTLYHLIRLITQEIVKLTQPKDLEVAFEWQGKLIKDSFSSVKN